MKTTLTRRAALWLLLVSGWSSLSAGTLLHADFNPANPGLGLTACRFTSTGAVAGSARLAGTAQAGLNPVLYPVPRARLGSNPRAA